MTREERENALHCLRVMVDEEVCEECKLYGTTGTDHCEADCVRTAIKALEQEPCENCVSRQVVLEVLKDKWNMFSDANDAMQESIDTIEALSNVTPQPKMGHWIVQPSNEEQGERPFIWWKCSNCGQVIFSETSHDRLEFHAFCGRCGSRNG